MNLTDSETFLTALIKCTKIHIQTKNSFPRETKQHIHKITMKHGWNLQVVQIPRK